VYVYVCVWLFPDLFVQQSRFYWLTGIFFACSLALALYLPDISVIIGIVGGTLAVCYIFIFPGVVSVYVCVCAFSVCTVCSCVCTLCLLYVSVCLLHVSERLLYVTVFTFMQYSAYVSCMQCVCILEVDVVMFLMCVVWCVYSCVANVCCNGVFRSSVVASAWIWTSLLE